MKDKIPFIIYAGDSEHDGWSIGPETERRITTSINFLIDETQGNFRKVSGFLLGAGIRSGEKYYPPFKNVMKKDMEQLLGTFPIYTTLLDGWGTFEETVSLYDKLKRMNATKTYVCSSWYHLLRIRFIWWIVSKGEIEIHYVASASPRIYCVLTECISLLKVLCYGWPKWKFFTSIH